jgi:ribosomal protein L17
MDPASIPGLQQLPRPTTRPAADKQKAEDEPNSRGSTTTQSRKRGHISSAESSSSEAQESSETEVKRLRRMLEELREENRQMKDRHEREVEDLKDQNRWLRKMFDELMKKTGGYTELPNPLDS